MFKIFKLFTSALSILVRGKKNVTEKEENTEEEKEKPSGNPQRDSQLREAAFKGTLCRVCSFAAGRLNA
jgi:hypothetical protein